VKVAWTVSAVGALLVACGGGEGVPLPDLSRVEAGVVAKVESCRAAVLERPSADTWARYGRTLHAHRMMLCAERAYLAAAAAAGEDSQDAFEHLHLAGCAALEGRAEYAVDYFQRALLLRDDYLPTHLCLALAGERLGLGELAQRHYERVLTSVASSHALLGLGRLALRRGDVRGAVAKFDEALSLNPRHKEVYEAKARAHARLKEMEESRAAASKAGDLAETTSYVDPLLGKVSAEAVDINSRFNRGSVHANAGRDPQAIQEFLAVVQARPRHAQARYYLAELYKRTGDSGQAMSHADLILKQRPEHKKALELRARLFLREGQRREAERDLRALLKVDPTHAWAKSQLGN